MIPWTVDEAGCEWVLWPGGGGDNATTDTGIDLLWSGLDGNRLQLWTDCVSPTDKKHTHPHNPEGIKKLGRVGGGEVDINDWATTCLAIRFTATPDPPPFTSGQTSCCFQSYVISYSGVCVISCGMIPKLPFAAGGGCNDCQQTLRDANTRSGRTQVLYKAHVLYCALFSWSCFFFSGNC